MTPLPKQQLWGYRELPGVKAALRKTGSIALRPLKDMVLSRFFGFWFFFLSSFFSSGTSFPRKRLAIQGTSGTWVSAQERTGHSQAGKSCFPARVSLTWEAGPALARPLATLPPPLPAAVAHHSLRGREQDGGAWSFDGFNYQIVSTSGWKIGIKVSLEPGSVLAPAKAAGPGDEARHRDAPGGWIPPAPHPHSERG